MIECILHNCIFYNMKVNNKNRTKAVIMSYKNYFDINKKM